MPSSIETRLVLPITLRPEDGDTGRWVAEADLGDDGYWAWGLGDTRYAAVRDLLHSMSVEMGVLHQDRASLWAGPQRDYDVLRAWAGEEGGDGA